MNIWCAVETRAVGVLHREQPAIGQAVGELAAARACGGDGVVGIDHVAAARRDGLAGAGVADDVLDLTGPGVGHLDRGVHACVGGACQGGGLVAERFARDLFQRAGGRASWSVRPVAPSSGHQGLGAGGVATAVHAVLRGFDGGAVAVVLAHHQGGGFPGAVRLR